MIDQAVDGARAGLVATVLMSGVMGVAGSARIMAEYPPERIARRMLRAVGSDRSTAERLDGLSGAAAHLAFGAFLGSMFNLGIATASRALLPGDQPLPRVARPVAGTAFGLSVYLLSYWGWIPALGLLPAPKRDTAGRQFSMLIAHLAFGLVLGYRAGERAPEHRARPQE
jgi:hypothetical protein